ncbi:hypothetical protein H5410_015987 [Solanum commersonii]|uniref:MSP domain-containing protein n=1 Tax=Solanum commersonii TaxID=4109 RepID=A0A9J5ZVR4_SOLCO|nr:hypothetical protein H5410_015987 [Solanum commersonii]
MPHSSNDIIVTMQPQKEEPPVMQCKDKFLLQSFAGSPRTTAKDINLEIFNKKSENYIEDCKLKLIYICSTSSATACKGGV